MRGKEALKLTRVVKEHRDDKGRLVRRTFERVSEPPWWDRVLLVAIVATAAMLIAIVIPRLL